jgi:hypothetical protein
MQDSGWSGSKSHRASILCKSAKERTSAAVAGWEWIDGRAAASARSGQKLGIWLHAIVHPGRSVILLFLLDIQFGDL